MDWLGSLPWGTLSPTGALLLVVLLVIQGKLVPASVMESRMADKDATLADLREAARIDAESQAELRAQLGELISSGKAFDAAWAAIRARAGVDS